MYVCMYVKWVICLYTVARCWGGILTGIVRTEINGWTKPIWGLELSKTQRQKVHLPFSILLYCLYMFFFWLFVSSVVHEIKLGQFVQNEYFNYDKKSIAIKKKKQKRLIRSQTQRRKTNLMRPTCSYGLHIGTQIVDFHVMSSYFFFSFSFYLKRKGPPSCFQNQ